jgi:hypothetical protein
MWAKWTSFYNRAKNANAAWSLFDRTRQIINAAIVFGAAMIAAVSPTWHWYWDTFSWAGVAIAFLVSWIGLAFGFFLSGLAVWLWRTGRFWKSNASTATGAQWRKILKEKSIYPGTSLGCFVPPSFRATFGADNENLRLFIVEMHYVPSMGPIFWTARRSLLLREVQKVSRDETIFIPLLSQHERDGHKVWQWGEGGPPEGGYLYVPGATYKGRITVTSASGQLEHCYFIITRRTEVHGGNDMPLVIGEDMFNFPAKWEAEDAENVEATSLK